MNDIIDICICSALNFKLYESLFKENIHIIPKNCFGVFVSVKRSKEQSLKVWPYDTHGCIGYWDSNYSALNKHTIMNKIISLSKSSTWEDKRKDYFGDIFKDSNALYEIDFMMKPLLKINENGIMSNNKKFNNSQYGIIIVNNQNKATYLPNVFPNSSWNKIKKDLIQKGNIKDNNYQLYAYKVISLKKKLIDFIKSYREFIISDFLLLIKQNYKTFIPYEYKNKFIIDKKQYVRNLATINDILYFNNYLPNHIINKCLRDLKYYEKIIKSDINSIRQASAFYLLSKKTIHKNDPLNNYICKYLYENIHKLEKRFELPEVLIALTVTCPKKTILKKYSEIIYSYIKNIKNINADHIFELNWYSKYFYFLYINKIISLNNTHKLIHDIIINIHKYFEKINIDKLETNYLAVIFEALSTLYIFTEDLNDYIFYIFYLLNKTYVNGLYYFKNNSARLDITGHILNGIILY